jgi:hypothetical protein
MVIIQVVIAYGKFSIATIYVKMYMKNKGGGLFEV